MTRIVSFNKWTPPLIGHKRAIELLQLMAETRGDAEMAAALLMGIAALKREARFDRASALKATGAERTSSESQAQTATEQTQSGEPQ